MRTRYQIARRDFRPQGTDEAGRILLRLSVLAIAMLIQVHVANGQSAEDAFRFAERFPGTGAKQLGMAGVSRAGMPDWTTVATNPAGLGWMKRTQVLGSLNTWSTLDASLYQVGSFNSSLDTESSYTRLGNAGYVYKAPVARGSMAFAIGYNQMNSFRRNLFFSGENGSNSITDFFLPLPGEFELVQEDGDDAVPFTDDDFTTAVFTRPLSTVAFETFGIDLDQGLIESGSDVPFLPAVVRGTVSQTGEVFEEGGTEEFTISGAAEVSPNVMVGAGLNLAHGNYRFSRFFDEVDINNENDGSGITTDFESLRLNEALYSNMWGVNLRTGVSAAVTSQLRIGMTVETPTQYSVSEDFTMNLDTFFDNGDSFTDRVNVLNDYTLTTPWRLGGGAALTLSMITISADAEFVDWSQLRLKSKTRADFSFDDVNRGIRRDYNSVVNANIGAALKLGRKVTIRGGYAVQPDPRPTETLDRSKEFISAGIGFRFQRIFEIDLGWTNERFQDRYQPYVEVENAPIVTEDITRNRVALGLRFYL
ncbi:MAG: OmpP1/FadL family transporter [Rhodothermia bacterium]